MSREAPNRPPRILERLASRVVARERRAEVLRDLDDLFERVARRHGRRAAQRRYLAETALLAWWRASTALVRQRPERARVKLGDPIAQAVRDIRYVARGVRKNPRFSVAVAVTWAIGIGATCAITSVVWAVLLKPLPYGHEDRLVYVFSGLDHSGYARAPISGPELDDLRTRAQSLESVASIWATRGALVEDGEPQMLGLGLVTWNLFETLAVEPQLGRWLDPGDQASEAQTSLVLSDRLWRSRFGGEPGVLGRSLRIDGGWGFPGGTYVVVGVAPPAFQVRLASDAGVPPALDAWIPFGRDLVDGSRTTYFLRTVGRLEAGATLEQLNGELDELGRELEQEYTEYRGSGRSFRAASLKQDTLGSVRPVILLILGAVALLLLVACANAASLLMARALARRREAALRLALGASRGRVLSELLFESVLLSGLGGLIGLAVARAILVLFAALAPDLVLFASIRLDEPVIAASFAFALITGLVAGLPPALAATRAGPLAGLRASVGLRPRELLARRFLVLSQVALGLLLLVGAGLLARTFVHLSRVDPGFDDEQVLTFQMTLPVTRYGQPETMASFVVELEERLAALPGARSAGVVNQLPLDDVPNWSTTYTHRGASTEPADASEADARLVSPAYFSAVGARLVTGRLFDRGDDIGARPVVIIDELLAQRTFPGRNPVGEELRVSVWRGPLGFQEVWAEVVGVVAHMRHHDLTQDVREQVFVPFLQAPRNQIAVALRTSGDATLLIEPLRAEIAKLDPLLPLARIQPLTDYVAYAEGRQRFAAGLVAVLAAIALLLASLGIYSVVSYESAQRRGEIGVRMALGADGRHIFQTVIAHALQPILAGIVLGLIAALALTQPLAQLLYGVKPRDPLTFAAAAGLLLFIALVASWLPARRAMQVDAVRAISDA